MKNKNAFTLAELLICFAIIGIISAFAVHSLSRFDKGIRYLYANTYHNIDRALYNAFNFSQLRNPFLEQDRNEQMQLEDISPEQGAVRLCRMLAEYLNTVSATCSPDGLASDDGRHFGNVKLQTLNGVDIYISPRLPDRENNDRVRESDPNFFLVYIDINGSEPPNSMHYEPPTEENGYRTVDPDVFAFAALDMGRMCPLGPPEVDPRYMQSRIAYVSIAGEGDQNRGNGDSVLTRYSTVSRPYFQAKAEAWGYYTENDPAADRNYIEDEPMSYNDFIRYILPEDTAIYEFLNGAATLPLPAGVHLMSRPINQGEFACRRHSGEECWVIVDRYIF